MAPPPDASGVGPPPNPANIQQRIDALLTAYAYAQPTEKPGIQQRIKALSTAIEYATAQ